MSASSSRVVFGVAVGVLVGVTVGVFVGVWSVRVGVGVGRSERAGSADTACCLPRAPSAGIMVLVRVARRARRCACTHSPWALGRQPGLAERDLMTETTH